jgi:quinol monooxygenase YgiN
MTEIPVILNVHFQAVPGHEEELGKLLRGLVAPTRMEPGCLVYELHYDPEDPGKFMFFEKFASQSAVDEHSSAPYLKTLSHYLKANPGTSITLTRWRSFA